MRFLLFLAFLTVLVAAQDQIPLGDRVQGWFNKAKSYIPTATPVVPQQKVDTPEKIPVPEKPVVEFDLSSYRKLLAPKSEPQEWYIFITGGNKTCFGRCERAEKAFNGSVNLFAAAKNSPNLGYLNCENNQVLCTSWSAGAPTVWHFQVPQAQEGGERPETPLHMVGLNTTTVTSEHIYNIWAEKGYEKFPRYEGAFHPTDSVLAQTGANVAIGWIIYGLGTVPSWVFMIGISFISRTMMSRRIGSTGGRGAQPAPSN